MSNVKRGEKRRLADDIRESLHEALDHVRGKRTGAVVHRVTPRETDAREARLTLSGDLAAARNVRRGTF